LPSFFLVLRKSPRASREIYWLFPLDP
jgi:hypothetical protein